MLWQRYRQRRVEWHIVTQWGFAKGYCVPHRPHRPFYEGVRHNIVCRTMIRPTATCPVGEQEVLRALRFIRLDNHIDCSVLGLKKPVQRRTIDGEPVPTTMPPHSTSPPPRRVRPIRNRSKIVGPATMTHPVSTPLRAYTKMPSVMSMPCFFRWASVVTS